MVEMDYNITFLKCYDTSIILHSQTVSEYGRKIFRQNLVLLAGETEKLPSRKPFGSLPPGLRRGSAVDNE